MINREPADSLSASVNAACRIVYMLCIVHAPSRRAADFSRDVCLDFVRVATGDMLLLSAYLSLSQILLCGLRGFDTIFKITLEFQENW